MFGSLTNSKDKDEIKSLFEKKLFENEAIDFPKTKLMKKLKWLK